MDEDAKIVEVINENYVVIHFFGMNIIYSVKDEKFNATRLVEAISDKDFSEWFENLGSQGLLKRFPKCFVVKNKKSRRLAGTYPKDDLIYTLVNWANPTIWNFLIWRENEIANTQGYVYFVNTDEYDKFKIGTCWHPKFKEHELIKLSKVNNMFSALIEVIHELKDGMNDSDVYQAKGRIVRGDELDVMYFFENSSQVKKGLC
jgi:hypothetical protein